MDTSDENKENIPPRRNNSKISTPMAYKQLPRWSKVPLYIIDKNDTRYAFCTICGSRLSGVVHRNPYTKERNSLLNLHYNMYHPELYLKF